MNRLWRVLVFLSLFGGLLWGGLSGCRSTSNQADLLQDVYARHRLRIGVKYDSPPFGSLDAHGKLQGLEIDLARRLAKAILGDPEAVTFVQVNSATRVAALQARQVDFVLATMTITRERQKVVSFTLPYFTAAQGILVKADGPIQAVQDLQDKRITYVIGTTGETRLKQQMPHATLLGFRSSMEAFSAFYSGRAEAFSTDDAILYGFRHAHCNLRLLPQRLSQEPYGIAFRREPASQSLQNTVETALVRFDKEGTLAQLRARWYQDTPPARCYGEGAS